jgi:peroxin-11B
MRLGKPVEHLQAALRANLSTGPVAESLATAARQVAYFGYLTYDALVWVSGTVSQVRQDTQELSG